MKIFYSEAEPVYDSYTFKYGIYCLKEYHSELEEIYNNGFLPYTGNTALRHEIFYLARSLRMNLSNYATTSENRRIDRKLAPLNIEISLQEKSSFSRTESWDAFCLRYAAQRMNGKMDPDRFNYIYHHPTFTHILKFKCNNQEVGYVFTCMVGRTIHYWFSFFDLDIMSSYPIGKWMMWKTIDWAHGEGYAHVYLGTCYGTKSLYKVRDFKGLSYFDGYTWSSDITKLKEKCKSDHAPRFADDLKSSADMQSHIDLLLAGRGDNR